MDMEALWLEVRCHGVRRVTVENCTFMGTDCGLRFKSADGRGGVVEDIIIDGIYMTDIPGRELSLIWAIC